MGGCQSKGEEIVPSAIQNGTISFALCSRMHAMIPRLAIFVFLVLITFLNVGDVQQTVNICLGPHLIWLFTASSRIFTL